MLSFTNILGLLSLYLAGLVAYRLYLSPLAKFPGPKIAALTSWYCAYHDIIRGGQYIWVVQEMHRKYGPVVRTMPGVLHVNDPSFIDKIYTQSPNQRRERAQNVLNFSATELSMLFTRDHNLHRRRRNALSRFFSHQSVRRLVPVINDTLGDLLQRMEGWAKEGNPVSLNPAYRAATKDDLENQIEAIRNAKDHPEGVTIFHEVLRSDLPELEKTTPRLVDEAQILAIAGADTTAMTLVALTYQVLTNHSIFSRLREELESAMPDPTQPPDPVMLDGLPFLNALIEEALRFYPSATHRQDRVAPDEDLVYQYPDGRTLTIPAGTSIGMTAPLVNRSAAWYTDPDEFNPDRYLENPKLMRRNLTFSKGMRQCIGINLAYQELQRFTAGIFRTYSPYDPSLKQQTGPTLELYQTRIEDIQTHADYVTTDIYPGSHGLRVRIRQD